MKTNPNVIGRYCIVRDIKHRPGGIVEAIVIDRDIETNKPKRIRLHTGEHFGEVRMVNEYQLLEFCEHHEAPAFLGAVWSAE